MRKFFTFYCLTIVTVTALLIILTGCSPDTGCVTSRATTINTSPGLPDFDSVIVGDGARLTVTDSLTLCDGDTCREYLAVEYDLDVTGWVQADVCNLDGVK